MSSHGPPTIQGLGQTMPHGTSFGSHHSHGTNVHGASPYASENPGGYPGSGAHLGQTQHVPTGQSFGSHYGGGGAPQEWQEGSSVVLRNLKAESMNGQTGTVLSHDPASGRWTVRLDTGQENKFKTENIFLMDMGAGFDTVPTQNYPPSNSFQGHGSGHDLPLNQTVPVARSGSHHNDRSDSYHNQRSDSHQIGRSDSFRRSVGQRSIAGGTLKVRVLAAYNLANLDTGIFGDLSDPFVVVKVGNSKKETTTIQDNLNPVWKDPEIFSFPIESEDAVLQLEIFNHNKIAANQSLGTSSVKINELSAGETTTMKLRLKGSQGDLEFEVQLVDPAETKRRSASKERGSVTRGAKTRGLHAGGAPVDGVGVLKVKILAASNLKNLDTGFLGDFSDPFVKATFGSHSEQTPTINNNLHPVWRDAKTWEFVARPLDFFLTVEVFNENTVQEHDSLGKCQVDIRKLAPFRMVKLSNKLSGSNTTSEGKIELEIGWHPDSGGDEQIHTPYGDMPRHTKQIDLKSYQAPRGAGGQIPLPAKSAFGSQAPPRGVSYDVEGYRGEVGVKRREAVRTSAACHLGQHDYANPITDPSGQAVQVPYTPGQVNDVDRKGWQDDPFSAWRSQFNPDEHGGGQSHPSRTRGLQQQQPSIGRNHSGNKDPFHDWLKSKQNFPEAKPMVLQEVSAERKIMSLPSFAADHVPKTRGHAFEYDNIHDVRQKVQLQGHHQQNEIHSGERMWKDDAFYGWLPGRGGQQDVENIQNRQLHRPLEQARLMSLPSFSENVLVKGKGLGVIKVWIIGASNLRCTHGMPSAFVRMSVASKDSSGPEPSTHMQETPTCYEDRNPRWQDDAFMFEVHWSADELFLEVRDRRSEKADAVNADLGSVRVSVEEAVRQPWVERRKTEPLTVPFVLSGQQGHNDGTIDIMLVYEPYTNATVSNRIQAMTQATRPLSSAHPAPRSISHASHASQDGHAHAKTRGIGHGHGVGGMLSVRVIAAFNLVNADTGIFGDVSDPFVKITVNGLSKQTKEIDNDLNPVWNSDPFLFPIKSEHDEALLEVYDSNYIKNTPLGQMLVPLRKIITGNNKEPVRIRDKLKDIAHGELELELAYRPGAS